jgi:hypothetical protein
MKTKEAIWILFIPLLMTFSACQSKQADEVLSMDDISESSDKYTEKDSLTVQKEIAINYYDSISSFSQTIVDSLKYSPERIALLDTNLFPDRFGASFSEKWYSKSNGDSLVFMRWVFQSDVKAENALFNWLDCFGSKCRAIPMGTATNFSKRGTMILCNQQELIFIETSKKINPEQWLEFIKGNNKKEWKFFFYQQVNRKIEWKTINSEGQWMDYNQKKD